MYDTLKCFVISASITLFANVPQLFEWPIEKISFGALLFFIIWTYMKHVLPKTQDEMERKNIRIAELIAELRHINTLREQDHRTIESLLREQKQKKSTNNSDIKSQSGKGET